MMKKRENMAGEGFEGTVPKGSFHIEMTPIE
jgi:hypothetical protein